MVVRLTPKKRREVILDAAVLLAKTQGYRNITREDVAKAAEISQGLVNVYFKSMADLRAAVLHEAVEREIPEILAQYLATRNVALFIPNRLRKLAADFVRSNDAQNTKRI